MAGAQTQTMAPAQEAGRPQPQTTTQGAGHPFITYSQAGCRPQYTSTSNAFGAQINNPLVAVPGYIRKFRVRVNASGGSATATAAVAADAPYSIVSSLQMYDSFGTPLMVGDGYSTQYLVPKYGGQHYLGNANTPANLPSYSALGTAAGTGTAGGGNFTYQTAIPFEFVKGVGCLSGANASLLPRLTVFLAGGVSSLYTTGTTANINTLPTVEWDMDSEFYWLPEGVNIEPPGLGSTCQWTLQQANPTIPSASTTRVQLPRFGGYATTFIFILRDANGNRMTSNVSGATNAGFPTRWRIYVDGVPLWDIRDDEFLDDMYNAFDMTSTAQLDTGVRVLSRKMSLGQKVFGLLDSGETFLSTSPGTLVEIEGAPWGSITTGPGTLSCMVGLVVPTGTLVTGLPEV